MNNCKMTIFHQQKSISRWEGGNELELNKTKQNKTKQNDEEIKTCVHFKRDFLFNVHKVLSR